MQALGPEHHRPGPGRAGQDRLRQGLRGEHIGLYPIATLLYSSTTLYQVSDHIQ